MIRHHGMVHDILETGLGHYDNTVSLAREAIDLIKADRIVIRILARNIESLTYQMKGITDITFERDRLIEELERQRDINERLRERLKKYEEK